MIKPLKQLFHGRNFQGNLSYWPHGRSSVLHGRSFQQIQFTNFLCHFDILRFFPHHKGWVEWVSQMLPQQLLKFHDLFTQAVDATILGSCMVTPFSPCIGCDESWLGHDQTFETTVPWKELSRKFILLAPW